jgi:hypothetical protein
LLGWIALSYSYTRQKKPSLNAARVEYRSDDYQTMRPATSGQRTRVA